MVKKQNYLKSLKIIIIAYALSLNSIVRGSSYMLKSFGYHDTSINTMFLYGILVGLVFLKCRIENKITIRRDIAIAFGVYIVSFLGTILLFPQNRELIFELLSRQIWICIMQFCVFTQDYDYSILYKGMKIGMYIILVTVPLFFAFKPSSTFFSDGLYMDFGYMVIVPAALFLFFYFKEKKLLYIALSILCTLMIFIYGNRGAVICYFAYILLNALLGKSGLKKNIYILLLFTAAMIFYTNASNIIHYFNLDSVVSRNINYILSGRFSSFETRKNTYNLIISEIPKHWLLGMGIGGDRMLVSNGTSLNTYAHNFVLEIIISLGIPLGITCLVFLIYSIMRIVLSNNEYKDIIVCLASIELVKLSISSSLFVDPLLYILIALIFNARRSALHIKSTTMQND